MKDSVPDPPVKVTPRRLAQRVIVAVVGATIVLAGTAMLVLPGPGLATILFGLALLATEFVWAKLLLRRVKERAGELASRAGVTRGERKRQS